ncbi:uncharacterized protein LOC112344310 isoform X2 [Selaginella moellendorffii]|uniref:uncharacterized protein LOC112344310 isoform X2 n=1 Tax=Selaginella moellendorffii TaxID=88036 RepID=UPI000D1CED88|nr:uncharacterized protein LOC112344310 isoform X2 [Selaginella moellendorffii]|eukprot:XP_024524532.1 uncharacterized protein LOC112344310 isoform X2 [Selaginella moellendorffii]
MGGGGSPDSAQQARSLSFCTTSRLYFSFLVLPCRSWPARNWDALRRRSAVRLRGRPSYVVHAAALVHDRITADEVVEAVQVLALPQAPGLLRLSAEQRSRPAPTQGIKSFRWERGKPKKKTQKQSYSYRWAWGEIVRVVVKVSQ